MAVHTYRRVRRRTLDRFRQKLWAIPAFMRLRVLRREAARPRVRKAAVR